MSDPYYAVNVGIAYYSIALTCVGTIGNMASLFICLRKNLRKTPTFIFMSFMMAANCLVSYFWHLNSYFLTFHFMSISDFSIEACRYY